MEGGRPLKIKLDENLSVQLKDMLGSLGHDVATASDEGLLSRPDDDVAAAAFAEGRMVFTLGCFTADIAFADMRRHPPGRHPGIVLFRPATFGPLAVSEFVLGTVKGASLEDLRGCVVVAEPGRIRVRRPEK